MSESIRLSAQERDREAMEGWTREVKYHRSVMCSQCDYMAREYRDEMTICTKCGWIDRPERPTALGTQEQR